MIFIVSSPLSFRFPGAVGKTSSGPLDADWPVSAPIVIASFVTSACLCAAALFWLISRHEKTGAEESGK
jgi:hypothetical protein